MKISKEQVAENRLHILDAAGRMFRERGFEKVTVAEIMQAAGLTHGAFYGHFTSKDELIAQAFAHILTPPTSPANGPFPEDMGEFAKFYLRAERRDEPGIGCLFATLGTESARASADVRRTMTESVQRQIALFSKSAPGATPVERRQAATASWASMIGTLILARIVDDTELSDRLMQDTLSWMGAQQ